MQRTGKIAQVLRAAASVCRESSGSQIAEFAVALPLLLIMVVGIFDFGNAYNIKQKVTNIAREAARMGASQSTADLTNPAPASILAIRDTVSSALLSSKLPDCGLGTTAAARAGNLVLSVDRGYVFTSTLTAGGNSIKMINTQVTLLYPYQWQFNRIITVMLPTAIYPGTTQISVASMMANQM